MVVNVEQATIDGAAAFKAIVAMLQNKFDLSDSEAALNSLLNLIADIDPEFKILAIAAPFAEKFLPLLLAASSQAQGVPNYPNRENYKEYGGAF